MEEYITIDQSEPISRLIGKLEQRDDFQAVIMDGDAVAGVFDPQALLKSRVDVAEMKVSKVAKPVPRLRTDDDLPSIASHMLDAGTYLLPIMRDDKLVGAMHATQVLRSLQDQFGDIRVQNIGHPQPITIHEQDRLDTALSILHDEHIDRLPVVDDGDKVIGFLSYKDILQNYYRQHIERDNGQAPKSRTRAFRAELPDLAGLPVTNFMHRGDIHTIDEQEHVSRAIEVMLQQKILSLLVLRAGSLVGMVTVKDILAAFLHQQTEERENIQYVGLEELDIDSYLKMQVRKTVSHQVERLEHYFNNEYLLNVHIKEYSRTGSRHKYSVHLRMTYPGATIPACEADAWNIRTAVQAAFKRLEQHLAHMYTDKGRSSVRKIGRVMPEPGEKRSDAAQSI